MMILRKDDRVIVFDSNSWMKKGDVGDNNKFFVKATVKGIRQSNVGDILVDVLLDDGEISRGHFKHAVKLI